eukprot:CAMPEP_0180183430 /NCGR_PEP_ID=MMETSP0986-20121125/41228_1 /TAXON_ID=697907 /ORGANISM="non described non described, Strain CCMP2293" /LENGTH=77 /DNA_ID=CAMNT_0022136931 /DNA_START=102 /DNA_END=335 /DNA_ORIENTATION=-
MEPLAGESSGSRVQWLMRPYWGRWSWRTHWMKTGTDVTHTMSEIRRPATASARSARVQPENIAINPATNSTADPRAS